MNNIKTLHAVLEKNKTGPYKDRETLTVWDSNKSILELPMDLPDIRDQVFNGLVKYLQGK